MPLTLAPLIPGTSSSTSLAVSIMIVLTLSWTSNGANIPGQSRRTVSRRRNFSSTGPHFITFFVYILSCDSAVSFASSHPFIALFPLCRFPFLSVSCVFRFFRFFFFFFLLSFRLFVIVFVVLLPFVFCPSSSVSCRSSFIFCLLFCLVFLSCVFRGLCFVFRFVDLFFPFIVVVAAFVETGESSGFGYHCDGAHGQV